MVKINLSGIVFDSVVDGPGLRTTIFTQGCPHKCDGCHNKETWSMRENIIYDVDDLIKKICEKNFTKKITISGGDPLVQLDSVLYLCQQLKKLNFHIIVYTGFTYDQIKKDQNMKKILGTIDVLIDGLYDKNLKTTTLKYRGSSNQKYIELS